MVAGPLTLHSFVLIVVSNTERLAGVGSVIAWDSDPEHQRSTTALDWMVRWSIGLHLIGDIVGFWIAYNAAMYVEYAVARIAMVPLYLLMILIYVKARPR